MSDPLFWLGLSLLFVAVSLTAVLVALIPAVTELARAARSAEKLFDTLRREFPPTLEAIRLTGLEISELTDDLHDGVSSASGIVKQVDRSLEDARVSTRRLSIQSRSAIAGVKAAWQKWQHSPQKRRRSRERLTAANPPSDANS
ncbi:MAG: DUF948 domain-containing protein [Jaaginema sp. PMC 1079.18]|nr:DUF948 domain-containing protein [Jaaginema sp. PMC 1080.18]MEC4852300.1 DUF948 domain-containing protein [Jaaginema sp. PMC 1079.18]MEC4866613.1 DUF948 domain-containing protein [Jaaginema sp. PMC 1078.18]